MREGYQSNKNSERFEKVQIDNVTLLRSTAKAGLYKLEDGSEEWIPFSQLSPESVDKDRESGFIQIPRWLADEKDLEYEEIE